MKKSILIFIGLNICFLGLKAQDIKYKTTEIHLDRYCCTSMNETIEKILAFERGVEDFELFEERKTLKIKYNLKKTNPEKIAKSLAKEGVMANGIEASSRVIERLPECCRASAKGLSQSCGH